MTTDKIFALVRELRRDVMVPMVFMTCAIVGSAIIKLLARYGKGAPEHVDRHVRQMRDALL